MLSSDHGRLKSRRAGTWIVLATLAVALAACTVQPLYGPSASGTSVKATLAKVAIDPVDDRVAQVIRNKLLFDFTGGGAADTPVYKMHLTVTSRETGLGITNTERPPVYSVSVSATYEVKRIDTDKSVLRSTTTMSATYNTVNQVFANTRAKLDAENRAAAQVANDIAIRVAAAVAHGL